MKIWKIPAGDRERSRLLAAALGVPPFAAHLMINRGMTDERQCREFLDTDRLPFVDPMLLPDMERAAGRVISAVENAETVTVYGDYDVDGITAAALIYSYLKEVGADVRYMLPSREEDGYGLNKKVVDRIKQSGTTLIITVDNGISARDEIAYASSLGIDTVVTDHHKPPELLPEALAVVDAFVPAGETLPFREWAGVGTAFKLACAVEAVRTGGDSETVGAAMAGRYAELVALGSIADIVPLVGENRRLTELGLRAMRCRPRAGTLALMRAAKVNNSVIRAADVSYSLAPRINSAGRMGSPYRALELLLETDVRRAEALAAELCEANAELSEHALLISAAVWDELYAEPERLHDRVTVAVGSGWNTGIVGISAGRLCDALGRPVIVLAMLDQAAEDGGECGAEPAARGSGRCFGGFSLYKALTACSDLLEAYGGHSQAAGLTIKAANIPEFTRRINRIAAEYTDKPGGEPGEMPVQELECDCELHPGMVTLQLVKDCAALEPFGAGNPPPHIVLRGLRIDEIRPLSGGRHHRITASRDGRAVTLLWFGSDAESMRYRAGDVIDCVVNADIDEYNGQQRVKLTVRDIRPSGLDAEELIGQTRLFERAQRCEPLTARQAALLLPSRKQAGDVYRMLYPDGYFGAKDILISRAQARGISCGQLLTAVEAMRECGLADCRDMGNIWRIRLISRSGKADLEHSGIIRALSAAAGG